MRVATWNVNSIRARSPRVVDWLMREDVDVLAMQEIKCKPEQFPRAAFEEAGYELAIHGLNQWNGVAFASRIPMEDVTVGFPGQPGFNKGTFGVEVPIEARALGVTVGPLRLWSLYVPNGRALGDPHYHYKLDWLAALAQATRSWLTAEPDLPLALMGDWNIAALDSDVGDPSFIPGASTHISVPERQAFETFSKLGLSDTVRPYHPEGYTFWDYKALRFSRNEGMRIDFIMGSAAFTELVVDASIHRSERQGEVPSDHVPVLVDLDLDDDGDPYTTSLF